MRQYCRAGLCSGFTEAADLLRHPVFSGRHTQRHVSREKLQKESVMKCANHNCNGAGRQCPLWVESVHVQCESPCLLWAKKADIAVSFNYVVDDGHYARRN